MPSRPEGFHAGFFCREPCRVPLEPVRFPLHVSDLPWGVNALDEPRSEASDGGLHSRDFGQIDTGSDDHRSAPELVIVSRPCLTPLVLMSASAIFFTAVDEPFTTRTSRQLS